MPGFILQGCDFSLQGLVLGHFALQKFARYLRFVRQALGGQHVDVTKLVFALAEVVHLDKALVDQGLEAVVEPAGAHAQLLGNFTLGEVWVGLQHAQYPKVGVLLELGAQGHGVLGHATAVRMPA